MQKRREGMALAMVMLLVLLMGSMATAAAMISSNGWLMTQYKERQGTLAYVADAGAELGRARLNGNRTLYPDSQFVTIENGVRVTNASGDTIPGVLRYTYAGPIGMSSGQYGVFGSVVSIAEAGNGDRVIRRMEIVQESFAKYAYFTDIEPSNIAFTAGDQLFGPVHSNDIIKIYSPGTATFHEHVTTHRTIDGKSYSSFRNGFTENGPHIPMPVTADLTKLRNYAQTGNLAFTGNTNGGAGQATMRLEFMAVDLNGDGLTTGADEGFMRVYRSTNAGWVVASVPSGGMDDSRNCGDMHSGGNFVVADDHTGSTPHTWSWALSSATSKRCYLGGADELWDGNFIANDGTGQYVQWPGPRDARLIAMGRADSLYLFPLSRALNPGFKGVIYVEGKVAISGVLRSRITLATTNSIIIADDVKYATDPSAGTCDDILGLFSGTDVVIANNTVNSPIQPTGTGTYYSYDNTTDEFVHAVVLALRNFTAEGFDVGSTSAEDCGTTNWGRGCLFLTGGIIQQQRGAVGTTAGTGYLKRYSYDKCAFSDPPPYFPTTGHFARSRLLEIDPTGFNVATLYQSLTGN